MSGTANGVDVLGEQFANEYSINIKRFPAKWDDLGVDKCRVKYNRNGKPYNALAGHNRNLEMAEYSDVLISFWDGNSTGTKNMIDMAIKNNLIVYKFISRGEDL